MLERLVLKHAVECTSQSLKRTGARVMNSVFNEVELSLTDVWRTWAIFDRRLSDSSYLWPTSVGLELSLTDVCRTWAIFDRRLLDLSYLWPTSVGPELSLTDVCRTRAIFDRRVKRTSGARDLTISFWQLSVPKTLKLPDLNIVFHTISFRNEPGQKFFKQPEGQKFLKQPGPAPDCFSAFPVVKTKRPWSGSLVSPA